MQHQRKIWALATLVVAASLAGCIHKTAEYDLPKIGQHYGAVVPQEWRPSTAFAISPSSIVRTCYSLSSRGVEFNVCMRDGEIVFLSTDDSAFVTSEGIRVGTKFAEMSGEIRGRLFDIPGWSKVVPLSGGWYAGFYDGPTTVGDPPEMPVRFFFKTRPYWK